jgi:hypothetical protein
MFTVPLLKGVSLAFYKEILYQQEGSEAKSNLLNESL